MVVFLPSYSFLNVVTAEWKKSGLITKLGVKKKVRFPALMLMNYGSITF